MSSAAAKGVYIPAEYVAAFFAGEITLQQIANRPGNLQSLAATLAASESAVSTAQKLVAQTKEARDAAKDPASESNLSFRLHAHESAYAEQHGAHRCAVESAVVVLAKYLAAREHLLEIETVLVGKQETAK